MPEEQFTSLKALIHELRVDLQDVNARIDSIHNHLKVCQTRCHVPGPPMSLRSLGKQVVERLIEKLL
jgi:hypothetical protein